MSTNRTQWRGSKRKQQNTDPIMSLSETINLKNEQHDMATSPISVILACDTKTETQQQDMHRQTKNAETQAGLSVQRQPSFNTEEPDSDDTLTRLGGRLGMWMVGITVFEVSNIIISFRKIKFNKARHLHQILMKPLP